MATWGLVLQAMSDAIVPKRFESESVLLKMLKKDSETLSNINNHFLDIYQRFHIHMVHENHKTDIKGTKYVSLRARLPRLPPRLPRAGYCQPSGVPFYARGDQPIQIADRGWGREPPGSSSSTPTRPARSSPA